MSRPPVVPDTSTAGIAVDPRTLDRIIPQSKRPDGTTRKEIKIRPGFTPQEDVKRFRGTKQVQMDSNALPKGHIVGWTPPTANDMITIGTAQSQSAKKNAKRAAKKKKDKEEELRQKISENWDDEDEPETNLDAKAKPVKAEDEEEDDKESKTEATKDGDADKLAEEIDKLKVH